MAQGVVLVLADFAQGVDAVREVPVNVVKEQGLVADLVNRAGAPSGGIVAVGQTVLAPDRINLGLGEAAYEQGAANAAELCDQPALHVIACIQGARVRAAYGEHGLCQVAGAVVAVLGDRAFGVAELGDAIELVVAPGRTAVLGVGGGAHRGQQGGAAEVEQCRCSNHCGVAHALRQVAVGVIDFFCQIAFGIDFCRNLSLAVEYQAGRHVGGACRRQQLGQGPTGAQRRCGGGRVGDAATELSGAVVAQLGQVAFGVERGAQQTIGVIEVAAQAVGCGVEGWRDAQRRRGAAQTGRADEVGVTNRGHDTGGAIVLGGGHRTLGIDGLAQAVGRVIGVPGFAVACGLGRAHAGQARSDGNASNRNQAGCVHGSGIGDRLRELVVLVVDVLGQAAVAVYVGYFASSLVVQQPIAHAAGVLCHDQAVVGIIGVEGAAQNTRCHTALLHADQAPGLVIAACAAQAVGIADRRLVAGVVVAGGGGL